MSHVPRSHPLTPPLRRKRSRSDGPAKGPKEPAPNGASPAGDAAVATVFVVDSDAAARKAIKALLRPGGYAVETFASPREFLRLQPDGRSGCALLDVGWPELSGLELQAEMEKREIGLPVVFVAAEADVRLTVRAMKAGALDFLLKPLHARELLAAVGYAIRCSAENQRARQERLTLLNRFAVLSKRERDVMALAGAGYLNKQIAAKLGTAEITIKVHRRHVMEKMRAKSFADLVRMTDRLGLDHLDSD